MYSRSHRSMEKAWVNRWFPKGYQTVSRWFPSCYQNLLFSGLKADLSHRLRDGVFAFLTYCGPRCLWCHICPEAH
jgi:hypothetical protein